MTEDNQITNNHRIAKNTMMLYIRMIIIMIVSLYTTRIVLSVLGEIDYGIYNIVGSVVVSMIFIQNSLMSATQRFFSFEIGRKDRRCISKVFSASMILHLRFLLLILLILETVGLGSLNFILDIPSERMWAANIVFQLSVLTFALNLLRIPFNSIIISYESMNIYALFSIIEAFFRLFVIVMIKYFVFDKLILYGVLILGITLITNILYISYCRRNYPNDIRFYCKVDKSEVKKMRGFLGWNLLGGFTGVLVGEGPNYLMNYYLGVAINASMGIAKQVSSAVYQFTANFQTAFNPQIVKAYAADEKVTLFNLINKTSLLSFYLLFIIALPIILCSDFLFNIWLIDVPRYTVIFCILIIIGQFMSALGSPLWMVAHATGDIKNYQISISIINLLIIPASYIILKYGFEPYYVIAFQVLLSAATFTYRLWFAWHKLEFPIRRYAHEVLLKCVVLLIIIVPLPLFLSFNATTMWDNIILAIVSVVISGLAIFYYGMNKETRYELIKFVHQKLTQS